MWSMSLPDGAAVEQLLRVKSGSFVTPAGQQDKQSSFEECHWQQSCDQRMDNSAAALYQQQTSWLAHDPKPAVTKARQLISP